MQGLGMAYCTMLVRLQLAQSSFWLVNNPKQENALFLTDNAPFLALAAATPCQDG